MNVERLFSRRSSSIFSKTTSFDSKTYPESTHSSSDYAKNVKKKQYKNLVRLENHFCIPPINQLINLKDADFTELSSFLNEYFTQTMKNIYVNDHLINVNKTRFKLESVLNVHKTNVDHVIRIDDLIEMDLLRNGLKSAAVLHTEIKTNAGLSNSNPNNDTNTSSSRRSSVSLPTIRRSFSHSSVTNTTTSQHHQAQASTINLNYQLVVNLNGNYFKLENSTTSLDNTGHSSHVNEFNLYKIKALKKPLKWSPQDYEQFTVETITNQTLLNKYRKIKPRYLNSKAVSDRLFKYFEFTQKHQWPARVKPVVNPHVHKIQIIGEEASLDTLLHNGEDSSTLDNAQRSCYLKKNNLILTFKWRGYKNHFREVKVNVLINLVLKIDECRSGVSSAPLNEAVLNLINNYFASVNASPIDLTYLKGTFYAWLEQHLNLNIRQIYLKPSFVHLWSLDTKVIKLNLLKFIFFFDIVRLNLNYRTLDDLISSGAGESDTYFSNLLNEINLDTAPSSNILMYFKLLQVFQRLFMNKFDKDAHIYGQYEDEADELFSQEDNDDLLINMTLLEINNPKMASWNNEYLFDRFWSTLIRLRSYLIVKSTMPDPFSIAPNQLPNSYLNYIGFFSIESLNSNRKMRQSMVGSFETAMKYILKNVITEEMDNQEYHANEAIKNSVPGSNSIEISDSLAIKSQQIDNSRCTSKIVIKDSPAHSLKSYDNI